MVVCTAVQVRENDMAAMVTDLLRPTSNPEIRVDVAHQLAHYVPSPDDVPSRDEEEEFDEEQEFDAHKADVKLAEGLVQRGAPVQLIEMMGVSRKGMYSLGSRESVVDSVGCGYHLTSEDGREACQDSLNYWIIVVCGLILLSGKMQQCCEGWGACVPAVLLRPGAAGCLLR